MSFIAYSHTILNDYIGPGRIFGKAYLRGWVGRGLIFGGEGAYLRRFAVSYHFHTKSFQRRLKYSQKVKKHPKKRKKET